ncbi:hypothetical protein [Roseovarius sp.]|uniref:hypothetical protein n=1 Tax=Roseovarius sp. TaxID=1486281 RepID=UPI00262AC94F|nr:hypothetical protein [Roseovarius sp.]
MIQQMAPQSVLQTAQMMRDGADGKPTVLSRELHRAMSRRQLKNLQPFQTHLRKFHGNSPASDPQDEMSSGMIGM